jgi:hypothetical protein
MAVEPVGRFSNHGPAAAPQWTWNKISRAVVALVLAVELVMEVNVAREVPGLSLVAMSLYVTSRILNNG